MASGDAIAHGFFLIGHALGGGGGELGTIAAFFEGAFGGAVIVGDGGAFAWGVGLSAGDFGGVGAVFDGGLAGGVGEGGGGGGVVVGIEEFIGPGAVLRACLIGFGGEVFGVAEGAGEVAFIGGEFFFALGLEFAAEHFGAHGVEALGGVLLVAEGVLVGEATAVVGGALGIEAGHGGPGEDGALAFAGGEGPQEAEGAKDLGGLHGRHGVRKWGRRHPNSRAGPLDGKAGRLRKEGEAEAVEALGGGGGGLLAAEGEGGASVGLQGGGAEGEGVGPVVELAGGLGFDGERGQVGGAGDER